MNSSYTEEEQQNKMNHKMEKSLRKTIHKIKNILKRKWRAIRNSALDVLRSSDCKSPEQYENEQNEKMESERSIRENWENEKLESEMITDDCILENLENHYRSFSETETYQNFPGGSSRSICWVFMPGQSQPIPVKLRSNKLPGGFIWVSHRVPNPNPDSDICHRHTQLATSSQLPQQQFSNSILV